MFWLNLVCDKFNKVFTVVIKIIKMIKPQSKPSKKRSLLHAAKITWMEFAQTTTMHGLKYATDIDGNFITK